MDGVEEDFTRKLEDASTRNDVYSRPVTYADLPDLPHPIQKDVRNLSMYSHDQKTNMDLLL